MNISDHDFYEPSNISVRMSHVPYISAVGPGSGTARAVPSGDVAECVVMVIRLVVHVNYGDSSRGRMGT